MIFREPHIALSSHWLIIAALWNYFVIDKTKNYIRYKIYWAILIGVAGLVHPYLGIMVLAISIASILREWLIKSNLNSITAISQIGLFTALLIAEWWTTGFFSIKILDKGERGFGFFSMNINGLINAFGTSRWIPRLAKLQERSI